MEQRDYDRLVEPHRAELRAHCYRMLGSAQDAEDALQEAMLRAWRGLEKFEGRSSLRSWLYRIATNVCLKMLERRPKLVLPVDYGPPSDPHDPPAAPLTETVWVEPFPDERLGLGDGIAGPEARYEASEAMHLAFIALLQHLPGRQRAALVLRDVLGFPLRTRRKSWGSASRRSTAPFNVPGQRPANGCRPATPPTPMPTSHGRHSCTPGPGSVGTSTASWPC